MSDSVAYSLEQDFECRPFLRPSATSIPFTTWNFCSRPFPIYYVGRSGIGMEPAGKLTQNSSCLAELTMICGQNNNQNPSCLAWVDRDLW